MSKIFAENYLKEEIAMYWRRFAELGTEWLNKYKSDPFFRTEVNVVALQIVFALVILGLVGTSFTFLYHDVSTAIIEGIRASIATNAPTIIGPTIVSEIQQIKTQNLLVIVSVIVLTTIIFGYIIARITLAPARNALSSQKQFIGNIAHELRTPLSVIKTNTEVALLDSKMSADLKNTLVSNVEELDRISEIINNLLSLSTLVSPERMEFAPIDLSAVAETVIEKYTQLAKHSNLRITLKRSPESLVWGNATALQQIVGNLLKNAIIYTPHGGHVSLSVEPGSNNYVELLIQDSGIGIARKDLFRIFEPFYRSEPSRTRAQAGSGLGLTIVSELLKLHQGKIAIKSAVGRGTTVSVRIPAAQKQAEVGGRELKEGLNEIAVDFSNR
jgi:signal transduction histidine kinase